MDEHKEIVTSSIKEGRATYSNETGEVNRANLEQKQGIDSDDCLENFVRKHPILANLCIGACFLLTIYLIKH